MDKNRKILTFLMGLLCILLIKVLNSQDCPPVDTLVVNPPIDNWNIDDVNNWHGLEIITWNIKEFPLSGYSNNYVNEIISDMLPDVINFQELNDLDIFEELAGSIPAYTFIHTDYGADGGFSGIDLGMAVRDDCVNLNSYTTLFPWDGWEFAYRYPLKAELTWECGDAILDFQLINVHYKCCDDGFDRRIEASEILRDYIHDQINSGAENNIIVAGDFNDSIDDIEGSNSLWPLVNDPDYVYFVTTPIADNPYQQSFPWGWGGGSFLDHILITFGLFDENESSNVATIRIDDYMGSSLYQNHVSDHRPVMWSIPLEEINSGAGLVINEIMNNPLAVTDSYGEWFEITNISPTQIDLNGIIIRDDGTDSHTILNPGGLLIDPGDYLILGVNDDFDINGGIEVNYQYSGFFLGNTWDEVILEHPDGTIIDEIWYDNGATFPDPNGASMMLFDPLTDNALGESWTVSDTPMSSGDFGTPGSENTSSDCNYNGDVNLDGNLDILDVVMIVGYILDTAGFTDEQVCIADRNQDGDVNVLDVVAVVGDILNG